MVNKKEIKYYETHNILYETEKKSFSLTVDNTSIGLFNDFVNFLYILKNYKGKNTIIEATCGGGWLSKLLSQFNYEITAFEQSEVLINKNREIAKKRNLKITYKIGDFEDFKSNKKFDIGIIYDALHHTKNPQNVIKMFYENLNENGILILAEPSILHRLSKGAKETTMKYGIIEEGFSKYQLKKLLRSSGFRKVGFFKRNEVVFFKGNNWFKQVIRNLFKNIFYYPKEKIWAVAEKRDGKI